MSKLKAVNIQYITLTALMSALILVLTRIAFPIPSTTGFIHLGDAGITFTACAFGPWVTMIAGGLGTMLADVSSGYAQWAIFSLIVHGVQGWVMGWLLRREIDKVGIIATVGASVIIVVGGYFVAGIILEGMGKSFTAIGFNVIQAIAGGVLGFPLYFAVRRAYPPVARYRD